MEFLLDSLSVISRYEHFWLLLSLTVACVILFMFAFMLWWTRDDTQQLSVLFEMEREQNAKALAQMEERGAALEKSVLEAVTDVAESAALLREDLSATKATIHKLVDLVSDDVAINQERDDHFLSVMEKSTVYLHDRFATLSDAEEQRARKINALLENLATGQSSGALPHSAPQSANGSAGDAPDESLIDISNRISSQIADLLMKERSLQQDSQSQTISMINASIEHLAGEVDSKLSLLTDKVSARFNDRLAGSMSSFHNIQKNIDELMVAQDALDSIGHDISSLARIMLSKGAEGVTTTHLSDMLATMLPDDSYILNPVINGRSAAAQLMLPGDQGAIIIDNSLQLAGVRHIFAPDASPMMRDRARSEFGSRVRQHISHVAGSFISPPDTGNLAMMFIASETAFAEIQAHHKDCVRHAVERQVWIVSPTTLAAALNMARTALKNQKAHAQLEQMRAALQQVATQARSFEARLVEIGDHVGNAMRSVHRAESAGVKLFGEVQGIANTPNTPDGSDSNDGDSGGGNNDGGGNALEDNSPRALPGGSPFSR